MKTTTPERDPAAAAKLHDLIDHIAVAMITSVTPDGALHSQPMLTLGSIENGELWFLTSEHSRLSGDIAEEHAINASYADPASDRYVSVSGQAAILDDRDRVEALWRPALARFFPRGAQDPHLRLLRVRVESAEYWDASSNRMQSLRESQAKTDEPKPAADHGKRAGATEHTKVDIRATPATG